jgi:hypothetical protein
VRKLAKPGEECQETMGSSLAKTLDLFSYALMQVEQVKFWLQNSDKKTGAHLVQHFRIRIRLAILAMRPPIDNSSLRPYFSNHIIFQTKGVSL